MDGGTKSPAAFRTISEAADELGVAQHVLRFWESKFPEIKPMKRGGNRRYYRAEDMALLGAINKLLYTDGYTIKGVQKLLADQGVRGLVEGAGVVSLRASPAAVPVSVTVAPATTDSPPAAVTTPVPVVAPSPTVAPAPAAPMADMFAAPLAALDPAQLKQYASDVRAIRDRLAQALAD